MGKASRRKAQARRRSVLDRAQSTIQALGGTADLRIRDSLPQDQKISYALGQLLESEALPEDAPLVQYQVALSLIVLAWNLSLLDAAERTEALRDLVDTASQGEKWMQRDMITEIHRLLAKKEALFPQDQRSIVSWDVCFKGPHLRITAAALAPRE